VIKQELIDEHDEPNNDPIYEPTVIQVIGEDNPTTSIEEKAMSYEIIEESAVPEIKEKKIEYQKLETIDGLLTAAKGVIANLNDATRENFFGFSAHVVNEFSKYLFEHEETLQKSMKKRAKRIYNRVKRVVMYHDLANRYGKPKCDWKIYTMPFLEAQDIMEEIVGRFEEDCKKRLNFLIDKSNPKKVEYFVFVEGKDNARHVGAISQRMVGWQKKLDHTIDGICSQKVNGWKNQLDHVVQYWGPVFFAEIIHQGICQHPKYLEQFITDVTTYFRSEEFIKMTGYEGIFAAWGKNRRIGKKEWKEVATNDPIYLKGDTGDFELYGIRLVKPYNDKIKTEMKIVPL